ncbi:winged helix-turn-helix transcriptional regulator [Natronosalvus rutilus]|uniref:Helix-turn-helix domain-containing protein n=1 Tax=Natronosalvus rutilus TaxID=2953753 RepID=A0A9E7ND19_9EURY|nr:helix-turn-helix domain-containing protein [Natronosalvus rutilus]UTF54743.1 helix-turn-helix domain-containing protein [Natronosalvus rutilus]
MLTRSTRAILIAAVGIVLILHSFAATGIVVGESTSEPTTHSRNDAGLIKPPDTVDSKSSETTLSVSPSTVTSIVFLAGHAYSGSSDPLEHDVRQDIYETVHQTSGIYIGDLRETHDLHRSTLRYHLEVLEQEELLASETVFGKIWYYPAGSDTNQLRAALTHEPTGDILEAIARLEPVSVTDLANEVDRSDSTVSHHLERLEDKGLVEQERGSTTVLSRLAPEARAEFETTSELGQWTD